MTDSYAPKINPDSPFARNIALALKNLGREVGEVNVANGWDRSRDMVIERHPEKYPQEWITTHKIAELGLITTEVSEAIEEVRHGHAMNETYYPRKKYLESLPESERADYPEYVSGIYKPEGVPSELADVIIRVLDLANAYGIDIGAAVIEKLNHNATRGMHHGGKSL